MKCFSFAAALIALGSLAFSVPLAAQDNNNAANNPQNNQAAKKPQTFPLWKAELPGGSYIIARNSINAVSTQQYVLDGVARVTEVNISTAGVFQPRFYYLEMLPVQAPDNVPGAALAADRAQAALKDAADSQVPADQQPWAKVVKNYPTTTHAGTIEFRLDSKEQLEALFQSVERTWLTGKSEVYTPEGVRPFDAAEELKNKDADSSKNGEGGPGSGSQSGGGNN